MNKKAKVKMLLDLVSDLKNIPTTADGSDKIDFENFYNMPEVKSVITLLKFLNVDNKYLSTNGFVVARMVLGGGLIEKKNLKNIRLRNWFHKSINETITKEEALETIEASQTSGNFAKDKRTSKELLRDLTNGKIDEINLSDHSYLVKIK